MKTKWWVSIIVLVLLIGAFINYSKNGILFAPPSFGKATDNKPLVSSGGESEPLPPNVVPCNTCHTENAYGYGGGGWGNSHFDNDDACEAEIPLLRQTIIDYAMMECQNQMNYILGEDCCRGNHTRRIDSFECQNGCPESIWIDECAVHTEPTCDVFTDPWREWPYCRARCSAASARGSVELCCFPDEDCYDYLCPLIGPWHSCCYHWGDPDFGCSEEELEDLCAPLGGPR